MGDIMPVGRFKHTRIRASLATFAGPVVLGRSLAASAVAAGLLLAGLAVPAEAATYYSAPLRTAARSLPVAAENNAGYDRTRYFGVWNDTNRDCQNTRQEVLIQESKAALAYTSRGCTASRGRWVTSWDNRVHTYASTVQIDHTVPVHEAWGSGARYWSQARRVAFYNDLGDTRSLSSQTSALNSAKQARGPESWMPPANRCSYIGEWIAVKIRWGLRVDSVEKAALIRYADSCPNVRIGVTRV
jgi:hypothetical protein